MRIVNTKDCFETLGTPSGLPTTLELFREICYNDKTVMFKRFYTTNLMYFSRAGEFLNVFRHYLKPKSSTFSSYELNIETFERLCLVAYGSMLLHYEVIVFDNQEEIDRYNSAMELTV